MQKKFKRRCKQKAQTIPKWLIKPEHWKYEHMIDFLAHRYGQDIHKVAATYTRLDFFIYYCQFVYNNCQENYLPN